MPAIGNEVDYEENENTLEKFASLDDALRKRRIPVENHALIRTLLFPIPITGYEGTSGYIKVIRSDSSTALHIYSGYTGGFLTEEEITGTVGDVQRWNSKRGRNRKQPLWTVAHPSISTRDGNSAASKAHNRDYGQCHTCFRSLPATRICDDCR